MRWSPFTIALLLLILPALGCASSVATKTAVRGSSPIATSVSPTGTQSAASPAAVAPASLPKVGQTAKTQNYTLTLQAVEDPATVSSDIAPQPGMRRVAVEVTITNTSTQPVAYNPLYAKVKLADNTEANVSFLGKEPSLKSGNLGPGESARGWLTFEVPQASQLATFSYEIISFGSGGRIVFDLRP